MATPSLFDGAFTPAPTAPLMTNGSQVDLGNLFSQQRPRTPSLPLPNSIGAIPAPAFTDRASPAWGTNPALNQPPSKADQAPPVSVLEHGKVVGAGNPIGMGRLQNVYRQGRAGDPGQDVGFVTAVWRVEPSIRGNGGLRHAVDAAGGAGSLQDKTWVGTLGMPTDALEDKHQRMDIENKLGDEYDCLTVWCKDGDMDGHYTHYCKQIPDNPKSKAYEDHSWIYYVAVNQAFADKIVKNYRRGDVIWVHDYHLFLVPSMVRKKIPNAKIGFFMHAAFPSSEVFRCLAVREELLEGLLGSNLIGFQTEEYCRHFLQTCSRILCVEATKEGVQLEERFVNVINLAIGIDPPSMTVARKDPDVEEWINAIKERYQDKKLIVARDKLNHVRGVRQKLLAYELFLNKYPQWRENTVLIQVAQVAPSMTGESELDITVADIVSRINSTHASLTHQPVVYLKQDISFAQYLALLTVADALMITSLREGMNLTCHQYIFCQDGQYNPDHHGALILSEFTGSAAVLGGSELSVNPWDYQRCANAIKLALEMDPEELRERWQKLYDVVTHNTAAYWTTTFLDTLSKVYDEQDARNMMSIPRLSTHVLTEKYVKSNRRLFILDYEGTLASWGNPKSIILTSPQRTIDVLNDLLLDKKNIVYLMSGRRPEELDRLFRRVQGLGIIAENGCFLKRHGAEKWTRMVDRKIVNSWKEDVMGILKYYRERTSRSWIEERHCSLIFHYSDAEDLQSASRQASECANHLNDACADQRVHAIPMAGAVHVEPMDWSKATAADRIFGSLEEDRKPDWLLVCGDDRDDEPIFRWANKLGGSEGPVKHVTTVCVGSRTTEAMAVLAQGVTGW
ncbi:MAG: hypothetical protein M1816_001953 [Peltula sp. TS41687]|nr:MAG: hypothetical protein M1816_001953 [Peltula sp. TS41687]